MTDIEIPLGKRTRQYRFFEILPATLSIGAVVLLIVLSLLSPTAAAIYILLLVLMMFVRAIGVAFRTIQGRLTLKKTSKIDWAQWLSELENPTKYAKVRNKDLTSKKYGLRQHAMNLQKISEIKGEYPKPSQIINMDFIAFVDESYDVLGPTLQTLADSDYDVKNNLIVVIAYEERGGEATLETVRQIKKHWTGVFRDLIFVGHPDGLPNEVIGKGPNLTYAGKYMAEWVKKHDLDPENIIVTSQDCDNRPDKKYFSYLTYEWIVTPNRQRVSFQPIAMFTNNIWDAPAPMRVIAASNSFFNMVSSMRPHMLRNFASHSQGMAALIGMNFWSTRTIVEDGHQYWRSYFYFDGDYSVIPLRIPFGQDAVLSSTYKQTLKAQFVQLRRWAYGASDVAYVAVRLLRHDRTVKFWHGWPRFFRLLEGHASWAAMAPIIAFGAFAPLFLNPSAAQASIVVNDLPLIVARIQQVAIVGLLTTVFVSLTVLPKRPKRYKKAKGIMMVLQWVLMPVNAIVYSSAASYTAQVRLALGKYMEKFDLTEKAVKK
ncbi:hypothetical protein FWG95_03725 [Candidatus Saccharibacteria bacterium]|nr:hypothetical protein [Candidatus Saccharibacteria bacterium]